MTTYPKIQTLFDRNDKFKVDTNRIRRPEYGIIKEWVLTEKIDGTNIRLEFTNNEDLFPKWEIKGRSNNATIPGHLEDVLELICDDAKHEILKIMMEHNLNKLTLFGEGYGPKIQSGGRYRDDANFILFDIQVNDKIWLSEQAVTQTAKDLNIDRVPIILNQGTIDDAIKLCYGISWTGGTTSFISKIAKDRTYLAEGVVAKTKVPLYDNRGERVMWKLKQKDFDTPRS